MILRKAKQVMYVTNTVLGRGRRRGVADHGSFVSLFTPKPMILAGEVKRVFSRVIHHTRTGYQLSTKWVLLHGRFEQSQLNGMDDDMEKHQY